MEKAIENFWKIRLSDLKKTLEANNFEVFLAEDRVAAKITVMENIIPEISPRTVSWGGSMTLIDTGIYSAIKECDEFEVLDTFDKKLSRNKALERRREALLADLFITGTNAVTETGKLINLDMIGNRVAGLTFGPKNVILLVGKNKIVPNTEDAISRVKNYTAPANVMRLDKKTPCIKTSHCEECKSPDRICNTWTITEKCFPKGRIKIVLIGEDLGL